MVVSSILITCSKVKPPRFQIKRGGFYLRRVAGNSSGSNAFYSEESSYGPPIYRLSSTFVAQWKSQVNGIKILSAMENIPDSPEVTLLESLLEGMNQYYKK